MVLIYEFLGRATAGKIFGHYRGFVLIRKLVFTCLYLFFFIPLVFFMPNALFHCSLFH